MDERLKFITWAHEGEKVAPLLLRTQTPDS